MAHFGSLALFQGSATGTYLNDIDVTPAVTAAIAAAAAAPPLPGAPFSTAVEYFGLTAGTGNAGPSDYAATVAVKTVLGTGRVPFPQVGPSSTVQTGVLNTSSTVKTLVTAGLWQIDYFLHTTEPGQLLVELGGVDQPHTVSVNMNPTAGGHPLVGSCFVRTALANQTIAIVNCVGNAAALTVTPADGSRTAANAGRLRIAYLGA